MDKVDANYPAIEPNDERESGSPVILGVRDARRWSG
jgi:hypothetical protein